MFVYFFTNIDNEHLNTHTHTKKKKNNCVTCELNLKLEI